jgi:hypothetical protein
MLDVGTDNAGLLADVQYLGYPHKRVNGKAYYDLVDEFMRAVQKKYPRVLVQFEDFLTPNAYALLHKYRDRVLASTTTSRALRPLRSAASTPPHGSPDGRSRTCASCSSAPGPPRPASPTSWCRPGR